MRSNFEKLYVEIYGESHAEKIGVKIGGIPLGSTFTLKDVDDLLARRKGGGGAWATSRVETDVPNWTSGIERYGDKYKVIGEISAEFVNGNVRSDDYDLAVPRPSHADLAAYLRDGKLSPGGGRFSGRMTAPLCVAGGIVKELLEQHGIRLAAYISSIKDIELTGYKNVKNRTCIENYVKNISQRSDNFPAFDSVNVEYAKMAIKEAAAVGDSVGGTIECVVLGVKAGSIGEALFEGLEGKIAYALFAIPAVKGVEFGDGFDITKLSGSCANDPVKVENGVIFTETNHSGGINGGISNGMPITLRVAIKPTPSIGRAQRSVNLATLEPVELKIRGRHDACIVPRAVPCVESAVALALLDEALKYQII